MIDILLVRPYCNPQAIRIEQDLKTLQRMVGGTIAALYPFEDAVALIVNDEGKLLGLPLNRSLQLPSGEIYDIIAGNFLVTGLSKDNFASLSPALKKNYSEYFCHPEVFLIKDGKFLSISL